MLGCNPDVVQLWVEKKKEEDVFETAYSVPTICPSPDSISHDICKNKLLHFSQLQLADGVRGKTSRNDSVDMIVGLDLYWNFIYDDVIKGHWGQRQGHPLYNSVYL